MSVVRTPRKKKISLSRLVQTNPIHMHLILFFIEKLCTFFFMQVLPGSILCFQRIDPGIPGPKPDVDDDQTTLCTTPLGYEQCSGLVPVWCW